MNNLFAIPSALIIAVSALLASSVRAQAPAWETDIDTALRKSQETSKDLLLVFRGPSVSPVCKRMNEEVFDSLEFRTVLGHEFVLFSVLAPEDANRDEAAQAAYRGVLKKFHVAAYPVILVANPAGWVYGQTAIQKPEAKAVIHAVTALRPRREVLDAALRAAAMPDDPAKAATLLSEALESLGESFAVAYLGDLVDKVMELDSGDVAGLKSLWEKRKYSAVTLANFNQVYISIAPLLWSKESAAEMVELLDATIREHSMEGELRQLMEMQKYRAWSKERNYEKMIAVARESLVFAPESRLAKKIPGMVERIEKLLAAENEALPEAVKPAGTEAQPEPAEPAEDQAQPEPPKSPGDEPTPGAN